MLIGVGYCMINVTNGSILSIVCNGICAFTPYLLLEPDFRNLLKPCFSFYDTVTTPTTLEFVLKLIQMWYGKLDRCIYVSGCV